MKNNTSESVFQFVVCIIAGVVAFSMLYPFYYCLVQSFNDGYDSRVGGVYWFPRVFTLDNYQTVFADPNILRSFFVTIARTIAGTITSLMFTAMFAYGLTKKILFRRFYSIIGIITMYFSGGLIPYYFLLRSLGLLNTFWVYIIPSLLSFYNTLLLMANFRAIPASVEESALIDGARPIHIYLRIILPLSTPILATIALFNGVWHWNDWYTTAIFTRSPLLNTLPTLLRSIINYTHSQEEIISRMTVVRHTVTLEAVRYATMMVAVLPITISYPFLQRYFVKGLLMGSVKA
ncbi:MAG: carbohydrate ABC transporter permease [Treponema sp.]|jgi:putative aldouronate transport system permease protein|nr:carbohydrate ABC transporter permease [Treponema sp.]